MGLKSCLLVLVVVLVVTISARPRIIARRPCRAPRNQQCYSILATPVIETTDCGCDIETIDYGCSCRTPCNECKDQLILPPCAVELPCGLGYFPAALPLVGKYFKPGIDSLTTAAYLPVADCGCMTLAAPICPDIAQLVKPVIL